MKARAEAVCDRTQNRKSRGLILTGGGAGSPILMAARYPTKNIINTACVHKLLLDLELALALELELELELALALALELEMELELELALAMKLALELERELELALPSY